MISPGLTWDVSKRIFFSSLIITCIWFCESSINEYSITMDICKLYDLLGEAIKLGYGTHYENSLKV
jgi:hypothetical protein